MFPVNMLNVACHFTSIHQAGEGCPVSSDQSVPIKKKSITIGTTLQYVSGMEKIKETVSGEKAQSPKRRSVHFHKTCMPCDNSSESAYDTTQLPPISTLDQRNDEQPCTVQYESGISYALRARADCMHSGQ
jgi:hypothetical protein